MTEEISALFDDQLDHASAIAALNRLLGDDRSAEAWQSYQLIGDAMRGENRLSPRMAGRLHQRLDREPTVLCPGAIRPRAVDIPAAWAAAAAVAGIAVVVAAALGMKPDRSIDLATLDPSASLRSTALRPAAEAGSEEFMLAHQAVSPSGALNGFSHYARTVAVVRGGVAERR